MVKDDPTRWHYRLCATRSSRRLGLGAIGTFLLIFAAWLLAHPEYLRAQRWEDGRVNAQISSIGSTATQFDLLVQQYIKLAREEDSQTKEYYHRRIEDPRVEKMIDLKTMPVSHWPSIEVYNAFNEYFFSSIMLMETSEDQHASIKLQDRIAAYEKKFEVLKKALDASQR